MVTVPSFLQTDPAGYIDTMNLYAYCGNNPVNWIDPWGLSEWKWFDGFWGTACDVSIVGTYFHFWYDRGANIRDFGSWLITSPDRARRIGENRRDQMGIDNSGHLKDPVADDFRDFGRDTARDTLNMPGTLTGGPLGVPDPVGDAVDVAITVTNEACEGKQE